MVSSVSSKKLIVQTSLQGHFLEQLQTVNDRSDRPLIDEVILYCSFVMGQMGESKRYFEISDGKFREKILGVKLMESTSYPFEQQKRALQDVGDTSLLLCGYFFESINKKIVDVGYYRRLGQTAYKRLNSIVPDVYDIPSFYSLLSNAFDDIVTMISVIAKEFNAKDFDRDFSFLLNSPVKVAG